MDLSIYAYQEGPTFPFFWECELCDTFHYFITELCIEEKGVGRILEQIILQMK